MNFHTLLLTIIGATTFFMMLFLGLVEFSDCSMAKVYPVCVCRQHLLLLSLKADTQITIPRRVEG